MGGNVVLYSQQMILVNKIILLFPIKSKINPRFLPCLQQQQNSPSPGLVYLILKHLVDRYNIFFAYNPSRINRHIHGSAVTFVLWAVILLQFNVLFFTGLRAGV